MHLHYTLALSNIDDIQMFHVRYNCNKNLSSAIVKSRYPVAWNPINKVIALSVPAPLFQMSTWPSPSFLDSRGLLLVFHHLTYVQLADCHTQAGIQHAVISRYHVDYILESLLLKCSSHFHSRIQSQLLHCQSLFSTLRSSSP